MPIRIRNAVISDIPYIEALEKLCFSIPWTTEMLRNQIENDGYIFLVAENESQLIGYMGMQYVMDEGYVSNVAAAPEFRQMGVASSLIAEMISRANILGLAFLSLEVRESNTPARKLYAKHGFEDAGRRGHYYEKPVEDAIIMTLYLK